jgi:prepilin-type processing-associated H-X9-DG protein
VLIVSNRRRGFTLIELLVATIFQVQPLPYLSSCDPARRSTGHTGGRNVALADGSLAAGMSATTWWAACTPNGGEVLGSDW